jgi:hypothetical protein
MVFVTFESKRLFPFLLRDGQSEYLSSCRGGTRPRVAAHGFLGRGVELSVQFRVALCQDSKTFTLVINTFVVNPGPDKKQRLARPSD